jgi:hypothetical protein
MEMFYNMTRIVFPVFLNWCFISSKCPFTVTYEEFEDTSGVIRIRISKRNRQHQRAKEKVQKNKKLSTKHTYKTKDRVVRTPLKPGSEFMCSGRVSSSYSTSDSHSHLLHCTTYMYSQNAAVSIMLPESFSIFNFAYVREKLIVIFQQKKL